MLVLREILLRFQQAAAPYNYLSFVYGARHELGVRSQSATGTGVWRGVMSHPAPGGAAPCRATARVDSLLCGDDCEEKRNAARRRAEESQFGTERPRVGAPSRHVATFAVSRPILACPAEERHRGREFGQVGKRLPGGAPGALFLAGVQLSEERPPDDAPTEAVQVGRGYIYVYI